MTLDDVLSAVRRQWDKGVSGVALRDAALVLTGNRRLGRTKGEQHEINVPFAGAAFRGGACSSTFGFAWAGGPLNVHVLAHEIAHLLGAGHHNDDDEHGDNDDKSVKLNEGTVNTIREFVENSQTTWCLRRRSRLFPELQRRYGWATPMSVALDGDVRNGSGTVVKKNDDDEHENEDEKKTESVSVDAMAVVPGTTQLSLLFRRSQNHIKNDSTNNRPKLKLELELVSFPLKCDPTLGCDHAPSSKSSNSSSNGTKEQKNIIPLLTGLDDVPAGTTRVGLTYVGRDLLVLFTVPGVGLLYRVAHGFVPLDLTSSSNASLGRAVTVAKKKRRGVVFGPLKQVLLPSEFSSKLARLSAASVSYSSEFNGGTLVVMFAVRSAPAQPGAYTSQLQPFTSVFFSTATGYNVRTGSFRHWRTPRSVPGFFGPWLSDVSATLVRLSDSKNESRTSRSVPRSSTAASAKKETVALVMYHMDDSPDVKSGYIRVLRDALNPSSSLTSTSAAESSWSDLQQVPVLFPLGRTAYRGTMTVIHPPRDNDNASSTFSSPVVAVAQRELSLFGPVRWNVNFGFKVLDKSFVCSAPPRPYPNPLVSAAKQQKLRERGNRTRAVSVNVRRRTANAKFACTRCYDQARTGLGARKVDGVGKCVRNVLTACARKATPATKRSDHARRQTDPFCAGWFSIGRCSALSQSALRTYITGMRVLLASLLRAENAGIISVNAVHKDQSEEEGEGRLYEAMASGSAAVVGRSETATFVLRGKAGVHLKAVRNAVERLDRIMEAADAARRRKGKKEGVAKLRNKDGVNVTVERGRDKTGDTVIVRLELRSQHLKEVQ